MQAACRAANGKVPLCMVHVKREPQHLVFSAVRRVPIWEMAQFRCGELRRPLHHWSGAREFAPSDLWKSVSLRRPRLRLGAPLHKAQGWCNPCAEVCKIRKRRSGVYRLSGLRLQRGKEAWFFPPLPSRTAAKFGLDRSRATARSSIQETPQSPARDCVCLCRS